MPKIAQIEKEKKKDCIKDKHQLEYMCYNLVRACLWCGFTEYYDAKLRKWVKGGKK